jgi:uncharacterized coiled-coil protein SlyX
VSPLFDKKEEKPPEAGILPPNKPGYQTLEQVAEGEVKVADQTALLADLSHQLEELRKTNEHLQNANRSWSERFMRAEAARDAMKELIQELWKNR